MNQSGASEGAAMSWIVRALLFISGVITSWFVSVEASNYIVYQLVIAVFLITLCAVALVYLPVFLRRLRA